MTKMTGPQLVAEHNRLAAILGVPEVGRFATREAGQRRVQKLTEALEAQAVVDAENAREAQLEAQSEAEEFAEVHQAVTEASQYAMPTQAAPKVRGARGEGPSLRELTDQYNALVPEALNLGLKGVKHHTSLFESKALGVTQVAKLTERVREAREARAAIDAIRDEQGQ